PIDLGPQIVQVAQALRSLQADRSPRTSATLPVVIGPNGVMADSFVKRGLPVVLYARHDSR
ncbi:MAG TPA: hypothetical protein VH855_10805, partial [Acetobacteraceae bacterium]